MTGLRESHPGHDVRGGSTETVEGPNIKRELKGAADAVEDVTNSRALELVARAGFAVSGILHLLVGLVAIRVAMGDEGEADVSGAVEQLAGQPAGPVLLWGSFAACVALALWQISDAIFEFEHLPGKKKLGKKLKAALQAVVYAGLAVTLASFANGAGKDHTTSTSDLTVSVMKAPGGYALLLAIGAAVAITGIVYVVRGFRQSFAKYLRLPASDKARTALAVLGVGGYAAKGIALLLAGLLIIVATVTAHPEESTGIDGGLKGLRDQPFGFYMLAAVGAGLICYGIFMMVRSRLAKM
ncbi:hypothetical protein QFZ79_001574 [Arthrobacter sp. V4I6]|nr:hypothetical protein [Arthrobacter sp. V1I7]MDQ0853463.1 hypothetical protein [Arthrobacter sp. V4I6]